MCDVRSGELGWVAEAATTAVAALQRLTPPILSPPPSNEHPPTETNWDVGGRRQWGGVEYAPEVAAD